MQTPTLTRRRALHGAAGIAGAAAVGGLGLLATIPRASAQVSIGGTTVATDDGDLSFVDLSLTDYTAVWDGFDVPVAAVAYRDVLEFPSQHGHAKHTHVLYDQRDSPGPVLLEDISSQGDGGDGWGGPDEYASEDPASYVQATGPSTAGFVHAGVDWRLLSDDLSAHPALSIETPAEIGTDVPEMDNPEDGTTVSYTLQLRKQVWFYTLEDNGNQSRTAEDGSTTVYPMGADDGTREKAEAAPEFAVAVENESSTTDNTAEGSTSGG